MIWRRNDRSPTGDIQIMGRLFPAADAAALADGGTATGAEYLVIAALDLADGSARRAFERAGADPDEFAGAVRAQHSEALRSVGMQPLNDELLDDHQPELTEPTGLIKAAPSATKLFGKVVKLVHKERSQLYGVYIVLVTAKAEHRTTVRALRHMGVDPDDLAQAARAELDTPN